MSISNLKIFGFFILCCFYFEIAYVIIDCILVGVKCKIIDGSLLIIMTKKIIDGPNLIINC